MQTVSPGRRLSKAAPGAAIYPVAPVADTRTPATMWELLQWAYAKQMVRYARDGGGYGPGGSSTSPTGRFCADLAAGAVIRGGIASGTSTAHEDAYVIDDFVTRLHAGERELTIRHAEAGREPDWSPRLPDLIVTPIFRAQWTIETFLGPDGIAKARSIRILTDKRGKWTGSLLAYEGFPPARASAVLEHARRSYEDWHRCLRMLRDAMLIADGLTRWHITGIGAERMPWAPREG